MEISCHDSPDARYSAEPGAAVHPAPLADQIDGLDDDEVKSGLWRDDVLALGGRLRAIYGNQLDLDTARGGYTVSFVDAIPVHVQCSAEGAAIHAVEVSCRVLDLPDESLDLWEFSLRENSHLQLVRLSYAERTLWADYQLPFAAACGRQLETAVTAVRQAARNLRRELMGACSLE